MSDSDSEPNAASGGLTQSQEPLPMTQVEETIDPQDVIKQQYIEDPDSVGHVGIFMRDPHNASKAIPEHFFLENGKAALGSSCRSDCDIKLSGMEAIGMSDSALRFRLSSGRLRVKPACSKRLMAFSFKRPLEGSARVIVIPSPPSDLPRSQIPQQGSLLTSPVIASVDHNGHRQ